MKFLKKITHFFNENSAVIIAIATIVLVFITYFYLRETRLIREIADKSFLLENSPKVFVSKISANAKLNKDKKKIEITAAIKIKNVGKTEAKDLVCSYTFSQSKIKMEETVGPMDYLYPTHQVQYSTKMLDIILNEQQYEIAQEAIEKKATLRVSEDFLKPVYLTVNLRFFDQEGNETKRDFKFKYLFHLNDWVVNTEE
jgi:hypothetical protein